jgi:hypothetical protein
MAFRAERRYSGAFSFDVIDAAVQQMVPRKQRGLTNYRFYLTLAGIRQEFSSYEDWIAAARRNPSSIGYEVALSKMYLTKGDRSIHVMNLYANHTAIWLRSDDRQVLTETLHIFEDAWKAMSPRAVPGNQQEETVVVNTKGPKIFIGHGRAQAWRDLKDHLSDHHRFTVISFESQPRAGMSITEILAELVSTTNMAFWLCPRKTRQPTANGEPARTSFTRLACSKVGTASGERSP